jgi:hypothetical protein
MASSFLDVYTLRARAYPGLLVITPLAVTYAAMFPGQFKGLTALGPILAAGGLLYLLTHLVREAGKKREAALWRGWGGKPTTVLLRLRTDAPAHGRDLIRSRLERIVPDVRLPTLEEERSNPSAADERYEAAVSALREATRNQEDHPVVFAENVGYGFRRNTWAIRPLGIAASLISLILALRLFAEAAADGPAGGLTLIALAVDSLLLGCWVLVSKSWVQRAATTYAEALFAAAARVGAP